MARNPDEEQGKLAGVDLDCEIRLLKATTHIDSKTAPQAGQHVRIVANARITDSGQKVVGDGLIPYLKATCDEMRVEIA